MAIEITNPTGNILPSVPESLRAENPTLYQYLNDLRRALQRSLTSQFNNSLNLTTAINSGTSGTFTISSGGSIIVTSGVVITVTS